MDGILQDGIVLGTQNDSQTTRGVQLLGQVTIHSFQTLEEQTTSIVASCNVSLPSKWVFLTISLGLVMSTNK